MSFYTLAVICTTAFVLATAEDIELPIQTCKHDSPDYSSCLRLAIQEAWPNFMPGIPALDLPNLDPYYTEEQRNVYQTDQMRADVTMSKVNTYGLSKARFLAVRPEHSDTYFKVEIDIELPKLFVEGDYKAEGSIGTFQVGGSGYFNLSIEDVKDTWVVDGPVQNDRWTIEHFKLTPEIGKLQVWFSDMFNGDQQLNDAAMSFVNNYWPSLYRSMLPFLTQALDERLTELANRVFSKVSFSKTFP